MTTNSYGLLEEIENEGLDNGKGDKKMEEEKRGNGLQTGRERVTERGRTERKWTG